MSDEQLLRLVIVRQGEAIGGGRQSKKARQKVVDSE